MSRVIIKNFRDPEVASAALKKLKELSLDKSLSVITRSDKKAPASTHGMKHTKAKINAHDVNVYGGLAGGLESAGGADKAPEALRSGLSLPEEALDYYIDAVAMGGTLVSLEADEASEKKISALFLEAERSKSPHPQSATFYQSSRMAATNSIDAAMSGDFRKY